MLFDTIVVIGLATGFFVWSFVENDETRPNWYDKFCSRWSLMFQTNKPFRCPACMSFWLSTAGWIGAFMSVNTWYPWYPPALIVLSPFASAVVSLLLVAILKRLNTIILH